MKAILVIDMPKCCSECDLIDNVTGNCLVGIVDGYDYKTIRRDCPLKPMPKKKIHIAKYNIWKECSKEDKEIMLENKGWNACVDYILGEE